ncbi:MAG: MerR family transcriptional regulator [Ilumatobacteraceae bacterium]
MATTYKIKEVSERTGFSAATLRYYEEIGLLPQPIRTTAGYRIFDDHTLERLAFIARAKQLGCTLDEIADLTVAWEGGRCGPVQDRLRTVVADKLDGARHQIVELMTLSADLQRAAATLELHRPDGPCDDRCGCVADVHDTPGQIVSISMKPTDVAESPAIVCTLEPASMGGRLDQWGTLLAHVTHRDTIAGGIRATFGPGVPLDELMRLVAAEQGCCQFFNFAITVDARGVALEVSAPEDALPIVHALFGAAA